LSDVGLEKEEQDGRRSQNATDSPKPLQSLESNGHWCITPGWRAAPDRTARIPPSVAKRARVGDEFGSARFGSSAKTFGDASGKPRATKPVRILMNFMSEISRAKK
jgi:hypothetical protein